MSLGDQPLGLVRITRILFELFLCGFLFCDELRFNVTES